jgi:hypothetical protein
LQIPHNDVTGQDITGELVRLGRQNHKIEPADRTTRPVAGLLAAAAPQAPSETRPPAKTCPRSQLFDRPCPGLAGHHRLEDVTHFCADYREIFYTQTAKKFVTQHFTKNSRKLLQRVAQVAQFGGNLFRLNLAVPCVSMRRGRMLHAVQDTQRTILGRYVHTTPSCCCPSSKMDGYTSKRTRLRKAPSRS